MKAIKDCVWEVRINRGEEVSPNAGNKRKKYPYGFTFTYWYWFQATTITPILNLEGQSFRTKKQARHQWERFAKINGIKKWRYV